MAVRNIEEQLGQLNRVREAGRAEAAAALRKALTDRVNLVVAKAANLAADLDLRDLIPNLLRAFDRLMEDAVKRDPQCWGKNAVAKALKQLEHRESPAFLRGARHVQMEPVWGGQEDTAAPLRGVCLLALVACTDLPRQEILRHLVNAIAETAAPVRVDAARALGEMGGDDSVLLLRLKLRMGDPEPGVTGQAFESLLQLERVQALPFVKEFLDSAGGDTACEAALALGSSRLPGAVELLLEAWSRALGAEYRQALLRALSISRQPEAIEFLVKLAAQGRAQDAADARAALALFPSAG